MPLRILLLGREVGSSVEQLLRAGRVWVSDLGAPEILWLAVCGLPVRAALHVHGPGRDHRIASCSTRSHSGGASRACRNGELRRRPHVFSESGLWCGSCSSALDRRAPHRWPRRGGARLRPKFAWPPQYRVDIIGIASHLDRRDPLLDPPADEPVARTQSGRGSFRACRNWTDSSGMLHGRS